MRIYSKEELIRELVAIRKRGWIVNARPGNQGGVGNTLEDLLGIKENNLPMPNAAEWELKCQRVYTGRASSLTTLFHMEPSPTALYIVPNFLLPLYGWKHDKAGTLYSDRELSFRQTINCTTRTDRGFGVIVDRIQRKVIVSFDATRTAPRHSEWLSSVKTRVGLGELSPQPYWGFDDLFHKAGTKLKNCFYIKALVKKVDGQEYYWYRDIRILQDFDFEKFLTAIENGTILVDFDARTGHNHGTKFRMRQDRLPELYGNTMTVSDQTIL